MIRGRMTRDDGLAALIAGCRAGYSLPRDFYCDASVYEFDLERIWRRQWLFAAYSFQLGTPGDFVTLSVGDDSLLVLRDDNGEVRAFHNVCRHRGTLLCSAPQGRVTRIVCPYHQWAYSRDGKLVNCRGMQSDLDKASLGLVSAHARELAGLVFISLAETPVDFRPARELLEPLAKPQGFDRAKIAAVRDYEIAANWKLVWDNNRECYHCNVNHPQYIRANFDHFNSDDITQRVQTEMAEITARSSVRWPEQNVLPTHRDAGMAPFPDPDHDLWFSANRTILAKGWLTESLDGRQIAPLMGDYVDPDVGTLRLRTVPNFWNHSSCDHAVSTRLLPAGPQCTRAQVTWLVHQDAVEGTDYRLEDLLPFWQLTSEQDWELCRQAQLGVLSQQYRPGPLSTFKEYNVEAFRRWYLQKLQVPDGAPSFGTFRATEEVR